MAFTACGGGDDEPGGSVDAGSDARDAGRGGSGGNGGAGGAAGTAGTAGTDAGRADTSADSGTGGTAGTAGTGGSAGTGGAPDVRVDLSADAGPDVSLDGTSTPDARNDGGDDGQADSAVDVDAGAPDAGPDVSDASTSDGDATISADARDDGDAVTPDAPADDSNDGDAPASDTADAADAFDAPSCNDNNSATFDFYSPIYGCGHKYDANPNDADAWIVYDVGFHVDVATGLGWVVIPGSRSAENAATECAAHAVAGLTEWRMPTITDARILAGGCAPTMSNGTCPIADPGCLTTDCGWQSPACNSCTGGQGTNQGQYCKVDVQICSHYHTSSRCSDCDDAGGYSWIYGPSNGNFFPLGSGLGIPTFCVSIVPGGVPTADGG